MSRAHVGPGFWWRDDHGQLHPAFATRHPDVCISRRVADFPGGVAPAAATIGTCAKCNAAIASDGRFPDRTRVCLQCAGIEPLPIETP